MGGSRRRTGRRSRRCALSTSSSSRRHCVIVVFGRRACAVGAGMCAWHAHANPIVFLIWQVRAHVKAQQLAESDAAAKHAPLTPRSSYAAKRCGPMRCTTCETAPRARLVAYLVPHMSAISRSYLRAGRHHRSVRAARRVSLRPRTAEAQRGARLSTPPRSSSRAPPPCSHSTRSARARFARQRLRTSKSRRRSRSRPTARRRRLVLCTRRRST